MSVSLLEWTGVGCGIQVREGRGKLVLGGRSDGPEFGRVLAAQCSHQDYAPRSISFAASACRAERKGQNQYTVLSATNTITTPLIASPLFGLG